MSTRPMNQFALLIKVVILGGLVLLFAIPLFSFLLARVLRAPTAFGDPPPGVREARRPHTLT